MSSGPNQQNDLDTTSCRWGVQLVGDPVTCSRWASALTPGFDPLIFQPPGSPEDYVLCAAAFESAQNAGEVREAASSIVAVLNGVFAAISGRKGLSPGSIFEFREDGTIHRTMFAEAGLIELDDMTSSIRLTQYDCNGNEILPPPPIESRAQLWARIAADDDDAADLLTHFGRSTNDWFEIYKTIEVAKSLGKRLGSFDRLVGAEGKNVEAIRVTANAKRHWRKSTYQPPENISISNAKPLLRWMVGTLMDALIAEAKGGQ